MPSATAWLALAARAARSNFAPLASPYKLTVALTYRCNSRCAACGIWRKPASPEMDAAAFREVFGRAGDPSWVDLTGGEIFLRDDLDEIVDGILDACPRLFLLHFPTSGLFPERAEALCRRIRARSGGGPRTVVSVSLDGPPRLDDEIRGIPGAFDLAVETFRRLRSVDGVETYLGMTLMDANLDRIAETVEAAARAVPGLGPRDLHVNFLHRSAHYFGNCDLAPPPPAALARRLDAFRRSRGRPTSPILLLEDRYLALSGPYLDTGRTPVPCAALGASCFVDPAGGVYACTIHDRPLGFLPDSGFDIGRIWRSPEAERTRAEIASGGCPQCWTPCEAYTSLLASWPALVSPALRAMRGGRASRAPARGAA